MCLLYICADAICNESILQSPWILFTYLVLDEINDMLCYVMLCALTLIQGEFEAVRGILVAFLHCRFTEIHHMGHTRRILG